jgi:hypothetical protein
MRNQDPCSKSCDERASLTSLEKMIVALCVTIAVSAIILWIDYLLPGYAGELKALVWYFGIMIPSAALATFGLILSLP